MLCFWFWLVVALLPCVYGMKERLSDTIVVSAELLLQREFYFHKLDIRQQRINDYRQPQGLIQPAARYCTNFYVVIASTSTSSSTFTVAFMATLMLSFLDIRVVAQDNTTAAATNTTDPTYAVGADAAGKETGAPQEMDTSGFTCASKVGDETNTAQCTQYKTDNAGVTCDCFYFCGGGVVVACMSETESKEFSCADGNVIQCFAEPTGVEAPAAGSAALPARETMYALWTVAAMALVCIA